MKTGTLILARRYSKAFDSIAKNTDDAAHNLASFEESLKNLQDISAYLANPTINSKVKENLIEKSLPDNIARALLKVLIKEKRFNLADEILKQLNVLLDGRRGIKRAQVTSAVALDDKIKTQIQTALENYFKTKLTLGFKEDKSLITGLKIKVGDFYIEDSSRSRLRELENVLTE